MRSPSCRWGWAGGRCGRCGVGGGRGAVELRARLRGQVVALGRALDGGRGRGAGPRARDPALDVALRARAHAERARGHVAADDAAGARVGAVADGDRGDEHVVRARAGVRADRRAVLVHTVVVDGHRGRADVRVLADRRVAHVREVRDLGAGADLRVLRLDERADLAVVAEHRAGAQVGERADAGARPDDREVAVRAHDRGASADLDVGQRGVGADRRALADDRRAVQLRAGQEGHVPLELDVHVDPGGRRVDHRHALAHPVLEDPPVHLGAQGRQLHPVVDALDQDRVVGAQRAHVAAVGPRDRQHVGQVHLALRVVAAQPPERAAQDVGVEHVDGGVDLGDRALLVVGVLLLDDAEHVTRAGLAQDAAVARRVGHLGGEHRDRVAVGVVRLEQLVQRRRVEQRHVAGDHDDGTAEQRVRRRPDLLVARRRRPAPRRRAPSSRPGPRGPCRGSRPGRRAAPAGRRRRRAPRRARARAGRRRAHGPGRARAPWRARGRACCGRPGCAGPWVSPSASGFLHLRRGRRRRLGGGTSPGRAPRGSAREVGRRISCAPCNSTVARPRLPPRTSDRVETSGPRPFRRPRPARYVHGCVGRSVRLERRGQRHGAREDGAGWRRATRRDQRSRRWSGARSRRLALRSLVADAAGGLGRSVVVVGEAGIGKSASCRTLVDAAPGARVLRVSGSEPERQMSYAGLHRILRPLADEVDQPPGTAACRVARHVRRARPGRRRAGSSSGSRP